MLRVVFWLFLMVLVGFFVYQGVVHPQLIYNRPIDRLLHPFDTKVRYKIGEIDPRFGLSREDAKQLASEAAQIWRDGTGQDWFVYDENTRLSINFTYDERQEITLAKQNVEKHIAQQVHHHNTQSNALASQKQALDLEFSSLKARFDAWQVAHNSAYYRLQHNNNPSHHANLYVTYENTLLEKRRLDSELAAFYAKQNTYNETVNQLNTNADRVRQSIDEAQSKFAPRRFHKGVFDGKHIEIYEFESKDDLRLVLAHELGHALAIGHNDDPTALMHPIMEKQNAKNFKLKAADIAMLDNRDGIW
ncbi:MAG: matrixin family metalloprotease [Moraxella sp.]|nr:matrixin family metalloprotease [Moraxella sp.]